MGRPETTHRNGAEKFAVARAGKGPRTAQGKERSKQNSLKHGIFSKGVVVEGESQAEYDSLLEGLRVDFQPVGTFESTLVENVASTFWRLRRLLTAEGAAIRAGSEFIEQDEKQRQFAEAGEILSSCASGLMREKTNQIVLEKCLDLLEELRDAIKGHGFNPARDEAALSTLYGPCEAERLEETLFDIYRLFSTAASAPDDVREQAEFLSPEACRKGFLKELSSEIDRLQRYKKEQTSLQSRRRELESLCHRVPDALNLDRLLKYQTAIERSLDRTLNQLDRAQRTRLGQPVAPRIDVNVSPS